MNKITKVGIGVLFSGGAMVVVPPLFGSDDVNASATPLLLLLDFVTVLGLVAIPIGISLFIFGMAKGATQN